ncbi:tRNA pseudouridine(55) synthase TruB [Orrella sp. 11846]|uniref:tRNA pseudouridine(55) synthase TruB n=1 Tax=Orrella sp. 11846 TaxID=3409913 RepID=UPI003B5CDD4B
MRKRRGRVLDGLLLLDKPVGLSSNHALQRAKRLYDAQKAGHTGTLDPFATGLLICCFGRMTKLATALLDADKTYLAQLQFGVQTTSGDPEGEVTTRHEGQIDLNEAVLTEVLSKFEGEIQQVPPMTSALKHRGKPLYTYARQGIEIERPPRTVQIHSLKLHSIEGTQAWVEVHCSKGTYVRTLAQDIGLALGVGAYLTQLRRTRIGPFDMKDGWALEQLSENDDRDQCLIRYDELPQELKDALPWRPE